MEGCTRRSFLHRRPWRSRLLCTPTLSSAEISKSPFRISVINDEVSPDFDHVCYVVSHDFGLSWIELRSMWGKSIVALNEPKSANPKRSLPSTICRSLTSPVPLQD